MALTAENKKYKIQAQPLVDVPGLFQLRYDDLGNDAVKILNERFKGNNNVVLDTSNLSNNHPIGYSNPYRRFALGPIIRKLVPDAQLLSPALSEVALKNNKLPDAITTYEDLGIVVYSSKDPNSELAKHLIEQAKERGLEVEFPMVFYGLKTIKDDKFPDGLRFDLDDIAVAYSVPILKKETSNFSTDDPGLVKNGFPSKLGRGNRNLFTSDSGLRRLCRGWDLSLGAGYDVLSGSDKAGRVSFLKGEAPQNLEKALAGIEAEKKRQIDAVEARYGKALEIMGK